MSQAKKCPQCGTIVDLEQRTCPSCQHFFRTTFDPDNPQVSERPVPTPLNPTGETPPPRTTVVNVPNLWRQFGRRDQRAHPYAGLIGIVGVILVLVFIGFIGYALYHVGVTAPAASQPQ